MTSHTRYQVEHRTICSGWTNTWTKEDADGHVVPQMFASRAEAAAAIAEFLEDVRAAVGAGDMVETYRRADFRVRVVLSRPGAEA